MSSEVVPRANWPALPSWYAVGHGAVAVWLRPLTSSAVPLSRIDVVGAPVSSNAATTPMSTQVPAPPVERYSLYRIGSPESGPVGVANVNVAVPVGPVTACVTSVEPAISPYRLITADTW